MLEIIRSRGEDPSEDSEARWRKLLNRWEAAQDYSLMVKLSREAEQMCTVDPLPETLEGNYKYLRDKSKDAADALLEMRNRLNQWENEIENAVRKGSVQHAIMIGSRVLHQRNEMEHSSCWPQGCVKEANTLIDLARELIAREVANWIPRQICQSAPQVADFRRRTGKDAEGLEQLGFHKEAQALTNQAHQCILKVEKLQQFSLTLAQCNDYPHQSEPTDSTPVRTLRDEITRGNELIKGIQSATAALSAAEIAAHVTAIKQRQEKLQAAQKRQQDTLGALYELPLNSQEALQEALTKVNRLREIFVDTRDENEVNGLAIQLERMLSDIASWEAGDVSVERLEELLTHQVEHQLAALQTFLGEREIEPAWEVAAIYRALAGERLEAARRRSEDWIRPRLALAQHIPSLDRQRCQSLAWELAAAPAYLSAPHAAQIVQLLEVVQSRIAELDELERSAKVAGWQQRYLNLADIEHLERHTTEQWLQDLRHPPCDLRPEEQATLAPIINRLTVHLDQLSMDELFARIERLSEPQQRELLARLSTLLEGQSAIAVKH